MVFPLRAGWFLVLPQHCTGTCFIAERDWDQLHRPKNMWMAPAREAGKLPEFPQWLTEEQSREFPSSSPKVPGVVGPVSMLGFSLDNKAKRSCAQLARVGDNFAENLESTMLRRTVLAGLLVSVYLVTPLYAAFVGDELSARASQESDSDTPEKHPKRETLAIVVPDDVFENRGTLGIFIRYNSSAGATKGTVTAKIKRMNQAGETKTLTTFKKVPVEGGFAGDCTTLQNTPLEKGDLLFVEWVFKKMPQTTYFSYAVEFAPGVFSVGC